MWTFETITGKLLDSAEVVRGIGYSGGDCGKRPDAVNNPLCEAEVDVGPIVEGRYTADYLKIAHPRLGQFAVHLAPDAATTAKIAGFGRDPDSFYMHGDSIMFPGQRAASDGCVIMSLDIRKEFWRGIDHDLDVVASLDPSQSNGFGTGGN